MVKKNKAKIFLAFGGGLMIAAIANADEKKEPPFHLTGTTFVTINTKEVLPDGSKGSKTIALHKVIPSESFTKRQKDFFQIAKSTAERDYSTGITPFSQSPGAVDLGMNNVPVLDQGQYGTCVTFSTTAAMDALLGKGDFISQQCTLELSKAIGNDIWNGAYYSSEIIDPLKKYGIVQQNKCNAAYANPYAIITTSGYKTRADKVVTAKNINYKYTDAISITAIKSALKAGHRVTIGVGLYTSQDPISVQGFDMTIAGQHTTGGLWACQQSTSRSNYCGSPNAGHEIVVIGYDDNQQLLKIRNSWSTDVGDQGNFYMTYTFFSTMNGDGTEIY